MKTPAVLIAILLLNISINFSVSAQQVDKELKLKPGMIWMENDKPAIGLDLGLGYKRDTTHVGDSKKYPRINSLEFKVGGTLLINPDQNPNTQKAEFFWGRLISFQKEAQYNLGQPPIPAKDFGSLGLGIDLGYEASQDFSEQNLESGAELRYMNSSNIWMPVLYATYHFVRPIASDIRDALNEDKDFYRRLNLNLSWNIPLLNEKRLFVSPAFNYFYSMNLTTTVENTGLDEGVHGSVILGYAFEGLDKPILKYLGHVFIQYNNGQLPVYADNRETIEGGLTFSF